MTPAPAPGLLAVRRDAVARHPSQQAITRVTAVPAGPTRLTVTVYFLPGEGADAAAKPARPPVAAAQVRIWADDDGRPIPQRRLDLIDLAAPPGATDTIVLTLATADTAAAGSYLLELLDVDGLDPFFATAPFTTGSATAAPGAPAAAAPATSATSDYLARDFASVRTVLLDRLTTLMPGWRDAEPADTIHTVVEILAYAADHLSYYQDAVGTEAHLSTARSRISVRRHARLLDYAMHQGCNARTWVQLRVSGADPVPVPARTRVLTNAVGGSRVHLDDDEVRLAAAAGATVFETVADAVLRPGLEALALYDWGLAGYTVPLGAISAALRGTAPGLAIGQVLLLRAAGALGAHPVRLVGVRATTDPLGDDGRGVAITQVSWAAADALPEPIPVTPGAVALGNLVLADHGHTGPAETLPGPVAGQENAYRPSLARAGLTWREDAAADLGDRPTSATLTQDPGRAVPAITVTDPAGPWTPRPDLLGSSHGDRHLVAEMEEDGTAQLRFGDDEHGRAADPARPLSATYRVGNGSSGNIGRAVLAHVAPPTGTTGVTALDRIESVTNPLPATGGTDPEPIERVRLMAPVAFRTQRRCVIEDDYVVVAEAHPDVRRASASFRWTGAWHTAVVVVERRADQPVDEAFRTEMLAWFEPYRLAGVGIDVRGPRGVAVDVLVEAGVGAGQHVDLVRRALADAFTEPEFARRSIGEPLYLSQVIAHAAAVSGVAWADVLRFQRRGQRPQGELDAGVLDVGPSEVLRIGPGDVSVLITPDEP